MGMVCTRGPQHTHKGKESFRSLVFFPQLPLLQIRISMYVCIESTRSFLAIRSEYLCMACEVYYRLLFIYNIRQRILMLVLLGVEVEIFLIEQAVCMLWLLCHANNSSEGRGCRDSHSFARQSLRPTSPLTLQVQSIQSLVCIIELKAFRVL